MTQGRYDAVPNCRPQGWDNRRHWTNFKRDVACSRDHMERESCPFHDLRANGQFQYEYCGSGVGGTLIEPGRLTKRSDAKHMIHGKGKGDGMGGAGIPSDAEAGRPQLTLKRVVDGTPWSHISRLRQGLFSSPEYIPEGEREKKSKKLALPARSFSCGSKFVRQTHEVVPHSADKFDDKIDQGRIFHFKAGTPKTVEDSRTRYHPCPPLPKTGARHEGPFYAGKSLNGTFNGPTKLDPEPYDFGGIKNGKRPLFTWYTHSKTSMPVSAPWSTGKTTAEPRKGDSLGTTLNDVPAVRNFDLTQTIGKEAALSVIAKPDPVQFRL